MIGVIGPSVTPVLNPRPVESGLKEPRVLPESIDDLRLFHQHVDRGDAGCGDGRRMRRGEEKRARAVIEKIDQRSCTGDVAPEDADGFRQRADLNIHAAVHAEVIDGAASVCAEHAARMRVVHHHDASELFGERAQCGQRTEVAVHAEHAVGDEQRPLAGRQRLQDLARGVDVLVREHLDRRAAQARTVDDARVVQLVRDNEVVLAEDRRHRTSVCREAALKHDRRFGLLERGEPALEFHVDVHRPGNRSHRSRADAVLPRCLEGALTQLRMRRQAEVIIRREIDDRTMIDGRLRLLLVFENAELPVQTLRLEPVQFIREIGQRIASHVQVS